VRQLELERLDRLLIALWDLATGGSLGAIDRVLKVMQRRAELLGLDKNRLTVDMEARGRVAFYLPERGAIIPLPDVVGSQHVTLLPDITEGKILEEQALICGEGEYAMEIERHRMIEDKDKRIYTEQAEAEEK
jgi:hypothetical protein